MKKLKIANEYIELLKANDLDDKWDYNYFYQYGVNRVLDISKFRYHLHCIVNLLNIDTEDKQYLQNEISSNNFTNLIIYGILVFVNEN